VRLGIAAAFAFACCSCAGQSESRGAPSPAASPAAKSPRKVVVLSALHRGNWPSAILFTGRWELVRNRADGRFDGSSSRSFHVGDTITLIFAGRRFCIYGVRGRNGGAGEILVSGRSPRTVDFHAEAKEVHRLVFDSGDLPGTVQSASLSSLAAARTSPRIPQCGGSRDTVAGGRSARGTAELHGNSRKERSAPSLYLRLFAFGPPSKQKLGAGGNLYSTRGDARPHPTRTRNRWPAHTRAPGSER
jgi:hypothetical protein